MENEFKIGDIGIINDNCDYRGTVGSVVNFYLDESLSARLMEIKVLIPFYRGSIGDNAFNMTIFYKRRFAHFKNFDEKLIKLLYE